MSKSGIRVLRLLLRPGYPESAAEHARRDLGAGRLLVCGFGFGGLGLYGVYFRGLKYLQQQRTIQMPN